MDIDTGNHIKYSQTSKGIWKCDGMTIYATSIFDAIAIGNKAIDEVNNQLKEKNKKAIEQINKPQPDKKTTNKKKAKPGKARNRKGM